MATNQIDIDPQERIVFSTKLGHFDGTFCVPRPTGGTLRERLRTPVKDVQVFSNAEITLTTRRIAFRPWASKSFAIPLHAVRATYLINNTGKLWWRNRVLNVVWDDAGQDMCTRFVLMGFRSKPAKEWKRAIDELTAGNGTSPPGEEIVGNIKGGFFNQVFFTKIFLAMSLSIALLVAILLLLALPR